MSVELVPLEERDVREGYLPLVWQSSVNISSFPYSSTRLLKWVLDVENHDGLFFAVRDATSGMLRGVIGVKVSWVSQSAQVIEFVFDRSAPNVATGAAKALVQYGESTLRLRRLWLMTVDEGLARLLESAGFQREGMLRRHFLHQGEYRDAHLLAYVTEEIR